jgi:hypothetical protein
MTMRLRVEQAHRDTRQLLIDKLDVGACVALPRVDEAAAAATTTSALPPKVLEATESDGDDDVDDKQQRTNSDDDDTKPVVAGDGPSLNSLAQRDDRREVAERASWRERARDKADASERLLPPVNEGDDEDLNERAMLLERYESARRLRRLHGIMLSTMAHVDKLLAQLDYA